MVASLSNMAQRQFGIAKLDADVATCQVRGANGHKRETAREQGRYAGLTLPPT